MILHVAQSRKGPHKDHFAGPWGLLRGSAAYLPGMVIAAIHVILGQHRMSGTTAQCLAFSLITDKCPELFIPELGSELPAFLDMMHTASESLEELSNAFYTREQMPSYLLSRKRFERLLFTGLILKQENDEACKGM